MSTVTITTFEQEFTTRVAGVSQRNEDGTDRQQILKMCRPGERVELRREPDNPYDKFAIKVVSIRGEVIGYIPAGDRRLADHLDRGGEIKASVEKITGGPSLLQRIFRLSGKHYGCVLRIAKGSFDWEEASPWMDASRDMDNLVKAARKAEKDMPDIAVAKYRETIERIRRLDSEGPTASAWRTVKYPIDRLSLVLDRQGKKAEALEEIVRWKEYTDPVGISDAERESVSKREARLSKALGKTA